MSGASGWADSSPEELRNDHAVTMATGALDRIEEIEREAVEEHILPLQGLAIVLCQRVTAEARQGCEELIEEYIAHPSVGSVEGEAELADLYTTGVGTTLLKAAARLDDQTITLLRFDQELGLGAIVPVLKLVMDKWQPEHSAEHKLAILRAMVMGTVLPDPDITRAFTDPDPRYEDE